LILSDAFGQGSGGNVNIQATSININQQNAAIVTGIDASSEPAATGSAGDVIVKADQIQILNGGDIQSQTFGRGNGGNVGIDASELTIDGQKSTRFTGISTDADVGAVGSAGRISIGGQSNRVSLLNGAQITSSTSGPGAGGDINVTANDFTATGGSATRLTGVFVKSNSSDATGGPAGQIVVLAGQFLLSKFSPTTLPQLVLTRSAPAAHFRNRATPFSPPPAAPVMSSSTPLR
jgi:large exoprotein involved in heme utilization and adhesion